MELSTQIAMHLTNVQRDEPAPLLFAHQSVMGDGSALATQSEYANTLSLSSTTLKLSWSSYLAQHPVIALFSRLSSLKRRSHARQIISRLRFQSSQVFRRARATPRLINPSY